MDSQLAKIGWYLANIFKGKYLKVYYKLTTDENLSLPVPIQHLTHISIFYMWLIYMKLYPCLIIYHAKKACEGVEVRGLLEKYPTFGREKETGLLGALDT